AAASGQPPPREASFGLVVRSLSASERTSQNLSAGVLVEDVQPGSAAERAGIRPGDVILAIDGRSVKNQGEFYKIAGELKSSKKEVVLVQIYRQGRRFFVTLYLE
ncbi:PDZ domain-containing protein, partial [bacterium]|nr:PDZ domain-containing protein [bacterium]